jgi:RNA polymerase sigma-70 factor (ECF subfamily)
LKDFAKYDDTELFALMSKKKSIAEAAFAELYSRHSQRIYAYILRVTGNQDDANDIFQESFAKFFKSSKNYKETMKNVPGFLMTISRNLCYNYKRDAKNNLNIEDFNFFTKDKGYEEKELLDLIAGALETLDMHLREAFVMRMYHGMSYQEISDVTGETLSKIKSRVWRSKLKIKEILSPYLTDIENL